MEKYSTQLETLQNVAIETDELISDVVKSQKLTSRGKNEKSEDTSRFKIFQPLTLIFSQNL